MAPSLRPPAVLLRPPMLLILSGVLTGCAGAKPPPPLHAAHGHAIATIERGDGDAEVMLERVEDEDTHWVELPHFGECPYDADEIPPTSRSMTQTCRG